MSTPDVFLPLLYGVHHYSYIPDESSDMGTKKPKWNEPDNRLVYGWGPPQTATPKEVTVNGKRYVVHLEMMVPPGYVSKDQDQVKLGDSPDIWRVIGPTEDYEHNPFGWNPGSVVNLLYVSGG